MSGLNMYTNEDARKILDKNSNTHCYNRESFINKENVMYMLTLNFAQKQICPVQ